MCVELGSRSAVTKGQPSRRGLWPQLHHCKFVSLHRSLPLLEPGLPHLCSGALMLPDPYGLHSV